MIGIIGIVAVLIAPLIRLSASSTTAGATDDGRGPRARRPAAADEESEKEEGARGGDFRRQVVWTRAEEQLPWQ